MEPQARAIPVRPGPLPPHLSMLTSVLHEPALLATTHDRMIVDANPAFEALFGYAPGELVGRSTLVLHPDEASHARLGERLRDLARDHQSFSVEWTLARKDGTRFPARLNLSIAPQADGSAYGFLGTVTDLTDARHAEVRAQLLGEASRVLAQQSLEPEAILRSLARLAVSSLADYCGVDVFTPDGRLQRVEVAHRDPAREDELRAYQARFPPDPAFARYVQTLAPGAAPVHNGLRPEAIRAFLGSEEHANAIASLGLRHSLVVPLHGRSGLLGALGFSRTRDEPFGPADVALAKELCERATTAYENAHLHRALRESEERFRTLVTAITRMVWSTDAEGRIVDMPEWRAYTGQTPDEVRGDGWIAAVHPEDRERVARAWNEAYAKRGVYEVEYRVRSRTGEYGHFIARAVPRLRTDGELIEYIGTWTDVTAQRKATQEAETLRAQLVQGEKLAALGSLVSGVAHEIRTPLTYLGNSVHLIENATRRLAAEPTSARANELLARVDSFMVDAHESIARVNRIVEDLRRYTKLKPAAEVAELSLDVAVADAVELYRATHRGQAVVHADLRPTAPVRVDRVQMQQVVLNLLQNAGEAHSRRGVVRIATYDMDGTPTLEVSDDGDGIPSDVLERIWDPFFTTKSEGTGLGLSIVKRIVDAHGARIACETALGKGTTFRVSFPPLK